MKWLIPIPYGKHYYILLGATALLLGTSLWSQNPKRLSDEVDSLVAKYKLAETGDKPTVVFTGSSSIRFWENLQEIIPQHRVINTGFGGSMASDLLAYLDDLVLQYKPAKVFIYEGDNDIEKPKRVNKVFRQLVRIVRRIKKNDERVKIVLIGIKPCPERWHLRENYTLLNTMLKTYSEKTCNLDFAEIWEPLLEDGKIRPELYLEDGLHLNGQGYQILFSAIKPYL